MTLHLINGESLDLPQRPSHPGPSEIQPDSPLDQTLNSMYAYAAFIEAQSEAVLELAREIRVEHDRDHGAPWVICERTTCRLAAKMTP